jgi:hypothetical protein
VAMICSSKVFSLALAGALALGMTSCRRSDHEPVYPVTGKVLYNGKPAEGAQITLVPLDGKNAKTPRPGAQVKRDGSFRLSTFASYDGAPPGRYAVTIVYRSAEKKENDENMGPDLLRGRYTEPKSTPLAVDVKEGTNELEPFQVQGPPIRY